MAIPWNGDGRCPEVVERFHLNQMELKQDIFLQNLHAKMVGEYRFI